jgi:hypothetical protein
VLHGEAFVLELFAVDRLAAGAVAAGEVATLDHWQTYVRDIRRCSQTD